MLFTSPQTFILLVFSILSVQAAPLDRRVKLPGKGLPPAKFPPAKPAAPLPGKAPPPVVPAAPSAAQNAAVCAKATTCDTCIKAKFQGGTCGFTFDNPGKCVPVAPTLKLATNSGQCKSLATQNAAATASSDDGVRATNAAKIFKGISGHVFTGDGANKKTSGRHLASTWIAANTAAGQVNNAATSLASFPFGKKKTKTVWNDQQPAGKYTQAIVTKMCQDAIAASMTENKSTTTPQKGTSSFSVASFPGGPNVCVTFSQASCFPAKLTPETTAVGGACTADPNVEE